MDAVKRLGLALLASGLAVATAYAGESQPVPVAADGAPSVAQDAPAADGRFLLLDARGRMIGNEDFPGRFQLVTFGYLSCPDVCPTTLATMASALRALGERAARLQLLFITVDPERDSSAAVGRFTAYFDPRIIGLSGTPELARAAAAHFDVRVERHALPGGGPQDYSVDHTAGTFLLDPRGVLLRRFPYTTTAAELAARIGEIIEADERR